MQVLRESECRIFSDPSQAFGVEPNRQGGSLWLVVDAAPTYRVDSLVQLAALRRLKVSDVPDEVVGRVR